MYHPNKKQFTIGEVLHPKAVERWGESGWMLLNPLLCISLQTIRNRHGRLRLNSKRLGFSERVLRSFECYRPKKGLVGEKALLSQLQKYAASFSAHLRGDAADFDLLDSSIEALHEDIKNNPNVYPFIHFVEVGVNWGHIDVRNQPGITFWDPDDGVVDYIEQLPIPWGMLVPELNGEGTS